MAKSKYGVPTKLPDGSRNPEYSKLRYKAEKNRIKVVHKKYLQSPEGKLSNSKCKTKWRALPPLKIIIGQPFDGAELHHMSKTVGIWVPKWVNHLMYHNVWTGKNIDKINLVAIQWYIENAAVRRAAARGAVSKKRESRLPHTPPVI